MASAAPLAMARQARAERDAHAFSLNAGQPTPVKLARLDRAFKLMLETSEQAPSKPRAWLEGALALRLVLISGREIEEIHALKILPLVKAPDPGWPAPRLVQVLGYAPALWLKAGVAPHMGGSSAASHLVGPASHAVWLGLDRLSEDWLRCLHPRSQLSMSERTAGNGQPLFAHGLAALKDWVEDFRDRATRAMGSRDSDFLPNLDECALFLKRHLAVCSPGDPAVSWLITKTAPTRNATTSYYSSVSLRDADRFQRDAVTQADSSSALAGRTPLPNPDLPPVLADRVLGSRFCPSAKALAELRDRLLSNARIGRGAMTATRASEVDYAFTAYSWLFFSLHAGWRPPRQLLPSPDDLDWATGAFFLDDKPMRSRSAPVDAADNEAWIEPSYELESEGEDSLVAQVDEAEAGARRRWLPLGARVMAQLRAFHIHVEERGKRRLAAPPLESRKDMMAYLKAVPGLDWDLPSNFPRHYLRSALVGKVSVEVINAYMGHWEAGAEPWWNGSCLDPVAYAHEARTAIDALLPECEWPVLVGFR
jgi:hypothetical protein